MTDRGTADRGTGDRSTAPRRVAARPATARRALAWGLVAAVAWVALAALSATWSPLARRPLLDGLIPGAVYRWVEPPPELEADNVPPSGGDFTVAFRRGENEADVVFTPDNQVTVVVPQGVVVDPDARQLGLTITPIAPSSVAPLPDDLEPFGNVVWIDASLEPGGAIETFDAPLTAVLVYPATPDLHATDHDVLWSADGSSWTPLETIDAVAQQQAQAEVDAPGLLVVGGVPTPFTPPGGDGASRNLLSTVLLVVAGASFLIGIGLLVRSRSSGR